MNNIHFEIGNDGVAVALINVAGRPMNVVTPELVADLAALVDKVATDGAVKGLVISSAKDNGFIAGGDLKDFVGMYGRDSAATVFERAMGWNAVYRRLETCGKPVACAVNGLALGGGLELALACHYRVMADNPKALLGLPEVKVGLLPGGGGTQRLPRLIGIAKALPLMLDGNPVAPRQALDLGIVNAVLPAGDLIAAARAWVLDHPQAQQPWDIKGYQIPGGAGCLAPHAVESFQAGTSRISRSTQRNYPAPLAILSCVFEGTQLAFDVGVRIEAKYFAKLATDPVARNLMRTMFLNKGAADKLTRRPANVPKHTVRKLGVLGAGMMGSGIAYAAAAAGIDVVLMDATQAQADKGKAYSERILRKDIEKGRTTQEKMEALLARILPTTDYAKLDGCDLVVEAVFESRDVKRDVTTQAAAVLGPDAFFASNTSTLPITSLAQAWPREERFIGIHFFSPVERMPLVEIIRGRKTGDEALARALDLVGQLKKTPIVVNDSPGFFTSRVFGTYVDEGMAMLAEGVSPVLIENAARMAGMPTGPLAISDEVTIELQLKVHEQARADGLAEHYQRLTAIDVVKKMVLEYKRIGRRGGAGFYDYPEGGKKQLWPGLAQAFPVKAEQPDVEELRLRFLTIQALESARCVEEGVITDPVDADLGSVLGIGYPTWTGGVLSYIDTVGVREFVAQCDRLATRYGARFAPSAALRARAAANQAYYSH